MQVTDIMTQADDIDNIIVRHIPVSSTLIEYGDGHLAIIDTGMVDNPQLVQELAEWGCRPEDFELVINTHLHCDHAGGNRLFRNARIITSRRGLEYTQDLDRKLRECHDPVNLLKRLGRDLDSSAAALVADIKRLAESFPVESFIGAPGQLEFIEDDPVLPPGFELIPAPGHTIADYAVVLTGRHEKVLVAGDALYHRDLWRTAYLPGINYNETMFKASAGRLSKFNGLIVPGHDRAFDNNTGIYLPEESFGI
ncbi:MAG: MBL fold metallo-hydrolase [Syntrophomonadaceae bacterium]